MKKLHFSILSSIALTTSGMVFGLCFSSDALTRNWSDGDGEVIVGNDTFTTDNRPSPYEKSKRPVITGITGTSEEQTINNVVEGDLYKLNDTKLVAWYSPKPGCKGMDFFGFCLWWLK